MCLFHRDCCIEETKRFMLEERIEDGGTTDEDYDFNCAHVENKECTCRPLDFDDMDHPLQTYGIKIRRFDESEKQWVKVESLGDKAVFLGYNTSFAMSASDYPAGHCIPNSIYFTYSKGPVRIDEKVCYDTWIYNMKDKSFKRPLYQDDDSEFKKPAPIWIVNSADT